MKFDLNWLKQGMVRFRLPPLENLTSRDKEIQKKGESFCPWCKLCIKGDGKEQIYLFYGVKIKYT